MKLHNTLSGHLEDLQPLEDGVVRLYTCGLTVYSQPHIGNWLGYIYWDVLVRQLEAENYTVIRTQNITDVGHLTSDDDSGEDKLEKGARAENITAWEVAEKYTLVAHNEGFEQLKLKPPTHLVRATDYIDQQIAFAAELEKRGFTYVIENEGLYFDTSKLHDYGKLGKLDVAGLEAGKRVAINGKRLVTDFAIWKLSPPDSTRDMEWDSPWGIGFPGWHLECSVIARETLGDQIDIHTGGIDHIPVHHTNEIAQTESVTGKEFSHTWLHNNHIKIAGTKISKSLGNIVTLADVSAKGYDINAFKLVVLSKHYRTEGNFDWTIMDAAQNRLNGWRAVAALRHQVHSTLEQSERTPAVDESINAIKASLGNDLDTPGAIVVIDKALSEFENMSIKRVNHSSLIQLLESINNLLGIDLIESTPDISDSQKQRVLVRQRAREEGNWSESDAIRDELLSQNIVLNDTPDGTVWSHR